MYGGGQGGGRGTLSDPVLTGPFKWKKETTHYSNLYKSLTSLQRTKSISPIQSHFFTPTANGKLSFKTLFTATTKRTKHLGLKPAGTVKIFYGKDSF